MSPLKYWACFVGIAVACITTAEVRADTPPTHGIGTAVMVKLAPPVACTMQNRLDMFIDEDDIMWECTCETLKTGHICRWQVIGGVDPVDLRRARKHHHRVTRGRLLVTYLHPGVVG